MSSPLPEFERPPVDEVVIGVQFEPLAKLRVAHFGCYWSKIRGRYPYTAEHAPIHPQFEQEAQQVPQVTLQTGLIPRRCWFLDQSGNELIQVQNDRFLRNWRQMTGDERYPRFAYLIERFKEDWTGFRAFLADEGLGRASLNQCELSYINHLEPGAGWKDFSELPRVFTTLKEAGAGFLPGPELLSWESRYKFADGKGRLHISAQPVLRARDLKLILALNLTARGAPEASADEKAFQWFDLAHEWIVRGFDQVTQPSMHAFWGKK